MTKSNLNKAILVVANATDQSKNEVMAKLLNKDDWTHFLIRQAAESMGQ